MIACTCSALPLQQLPRGLHTVLIEVGDSVGHHLRHALRHRIQWMELDPATTNWWGLMSLHGQRDFRTSALSLSWSNSKMQRIPLVAALSSLCIGRTRLTCSASLTHGFVATSALVSEAVVVLLPREGALWMSLHLLEIRPHKSHERD